MNGPPPRRPVPSPAGLRDPRRPILGAWAGGGLPLLVLAVTVALSLFALPRLEAPRVDAFALGLALDYTVTVPALVYFLVVRARRAPWIVLVPVMIAGHALASVTLHGRPNAVLEVMRWALIPAELALVTYLVMAGRRAFRGSRHVAGDFATRLRATAGAALGNRVAAGILTTEIAILYHAFRWPRRARNDSGSFTVHREIGYSTILAALLVVLVVESVAVHALASQWGLAVRVILAATNAYAVVWLLGDYRAMSARPTRLTATHLSLRVGLRWEADIPLERIERVARIASAPDSLGRGVLAVALLGQPNLRLALREPVEVTGMYGSRRIAHEILLRVDEADVLHQALQLVVFKSGHVVIANNSHSCAATSREILTANSLC